MKVDKLFLSLWVLATASVMVCESGQAALSEVKAQQTHLFFFFRDNGQDGVYLAASRDGLKYCPLNKDEPIFKAPASMGDGLTRDPSVVLGPDNQFHMVWTTGWWEKDNFGIAHSENLLDWQGVSSVPVMAQETSTLNAWAPEIFYDDLNQDYQVVFASTVRDKFPDGSSENAPDKKGLDHRQYMVSTKDFKQWSESHLFFDKGHSVIDAMIAKVVDGRYAMVIKDETFKPVARKYLQLYFSDSPKGPWSEPTEDISPKGLWVEGASLNKIGEEWLLYFDAYDNKSYGALKSTDLRNWQDISQQTSFPSGIRHGTVLTVPSERITHLLEGFDCQ
ncbi:glycoside hydrolase family 43 protein [Pseudoteredinibacter isoporae]|uniref:Beta-xylosidase n=1 Tax=Pseudoteredinibacter isoporae TaxID=570281 RepID=A0A7X0JUM9_9GAMM|nr:glycoside hydrolase family 43 protein [Pseudoteredinibacter isoporae]MBB6522568.1 beta-xylosidase [Pseudoteredinibacter isoporae]NHO88098.1 glycoside hydrolase family 43 protein [Pseudoteredinibacter isoporae]NIB23571.1 glycoside hydrolase family 43 protein [Pseudoteredinibacter isoporae]